MESIVWLRICLNAWKPSKKETTLRLFLAKKWAKILNPDAYTDTDTKQSEASSDEDIKSEDPSQEEQTSSEESNVEHARDPGLATETDAILASVDDGSMIIESYEMG